MRSSRSFWTVTFLPVASTVIPLFSIVQFYLIRLKILGMDFQNHSLAQKVNIEKVWQFIILQTPQKKLTKDPEHFMLHQKNKKTIKKF